MFIGDIFDPFAKVYNQLKVKTDVAYTDNWLSMLHRKWSFIFALISLMIVASYTVVVEGNHFIVCFGPNSETIPDDFLQYWCFLTGTYINSEYIGKKVGTEVPHLGIGPDNPDMKKIYHTHYLFYPVIFLFQFFLFRSSKYVWKHMEGGRLHALLSELVTAVNDTAETVKKRIEVVAEYMIHSPLTFHSNYSYFFISAELFNAFSIIFQFWMIDYALNYEFLNFGWDAIAHLQHDCGGNSTVDPFAKVFPKVAKCTMPQYGPSGNVVKHEALCILAWNNIAEKLFFFWWIWLTLLGFFTLIGLMYRAAVLFSPCVRFWTLHLRTRGTGLCDANKLRTFCDRQSYGDWFVLNLIRKNLDPCVFATLLDELDRKQTASKRRKDH